jgi:hypothetical protein
VRVKPGKSTKSKRANEPKAPNRLICGLENSTWVRPKTAGMTTAALIDRWRMTGPGAFTPNQGPRAAHGRRGVGAAASLVIVCAGPVMRRWRSGRASRTYPR